MQRLLAFIENNLHLILFLVLQAVCGVLLYKLNPYQKAFISNSSSAVTANINAFSSNVQNYFNLGYSNKKLQQMFSDSFALRSRDYQLLLQNDTITIKDSLNKPLYSAVPAQVVYNSVHRTNNTLVINKGEAHGVTKGSGVISAEGVVGVVTDVGKNFSTVMSLLHTDFRIVPQINDQEFFTEILWDNSSPYTLSINKINKLEEIEVGDLVSTGRSSLIFPPNIAIGKISKLKTKEGSQYFDTEMTTTVNFRKLHYVFVIKNLYANEIMELIENE